MCLSRYHKHIKFYKGNKRIFLNQTVKWLLYIFQEFIFMSIILEKVNKKALDS